MDNELAGLSDGVRDIVSDMDHSPTRSLIGGKDWQTIRAELLRLARENANLRSAGTKTLAANIELRERSERAEAELAALKDKFQQADGMAACMAMVRDECVAAGVFPDTLAPMFYPEAIIGMYEELTAGCTENSRR